MPELVAQWDAAANAPLLPSAVTLGSGKMVWWQCRACPCGHVHQWQARIRVRARQGTGCPVCTGRRPCACSSLAVKRPDIAAQWDTEGNGDLTAADVTVSSNRKIVWRCAKHQPDVTWTTLVDHRTQTHAHCPAHVHKRTPTGCPECAKAPSPKPGKCTPSSQGLSLLRHCLCIVGNTYCSV